MHCSRRCSGRTPPRCSSHSEPHRGAPSQHAHASRPATTCPARRTRRTSTTAGRAATGTRRAASRPSCSSTRSASASRAGSGRASWPSCPTRSTRPDFIGCGRSDPWDPAERGLFLPLDYSRQVEELWRQKIGKPCCVVAQGGLAPVGVYLASRSSDRWDGARAVAGLALSAPPPFADLAEGLDSAEVARNLEFLQSSLGRQLVKLLRSAFFVKFFSNLFLFADACDEAWISNCLVDDESPKSIEPVLTFNAGVVGARGLFDELKMQVPSPCWSSRARRTSGARSAAATPRPSRTSSARRSTVHATCRRGERPGLVADAIGALVLRARAGGSRRLEDDV